MNEIDLKNERLYRSIENVLAHMHRKVPPHAQMAVVRSRYPSPVTFVESNIYMLKKAGLSRLDAFYFTMIPALARYVQREAFGSRPRLNTLSAMTEYLKTLFIGVHVECFYVVLLDARGYLIDTVLVRKGTTDSAPFYLKEVLSIVVQRGAKAIVLCHNHPAGTLKPSQEDINCTLRAMNAVMAMDVPMLDHVIIAHRRAVSMRECGAIPSKLWAMQAPEMKLVRNWLDVELLLDDNS